LSTSQLKKRRSSNPQEFNRIDPIKTESLQEIAGFLFLITDQIGPSAKRSGQALRRGRLGQATLPEVAEVLQNKKASRFLDEACSKKRFGGTLRAGPSAGA
jgi:hypothetical protein